MNKLVLQKAVAFYNGVWPNNCGGKDNLIVCSTPANGKYPEFTFKTISKWVSLLSPYWEVVCTKQEFLEYVETLNASKKEAQWYDYENQKQIDAIPVGENFFYTSTRTLEKSREKTQWYRAECVAHLDGEAIIKTPKGGLYVRDRADYTFRPIDHDYRFVDVKKDETIRAAAKSLGVLCPLPEVLNALYDAGCLKIPDGTLL